MHPRLHQSFAGLGGIKALAGGAWLRHAAQKQVALVHRHRHKMCVCVYVCMHMCICYLSTSKDVEKRGKAHALQVHIEAGLTIVAQTCLLPDEKHASEVYLRLPLYALHINRCHVNTLLNGATQVNEGAWTDSY
jgi:hypothetical protein